MIFIEILKLKTIGLFTPFLQILIIVILFSLAVFTQRREYKKTGKTYGRYPWRISTFFSTIYEELIFRVFILFGLMMFLSPFVSIIISSILFGLWHLKNYKWQSKKETIYQVLYTGIIFGPIASIITLLSGTIWITVIFHYLNNLIANEYRKLKD